MQKQRILQKERPLSASAVLKQKKSAVCCFIQVFILLSILFALVVGLVYYFGTQQPHSDVPHALDEIFGTDKHTKLIEQLNKKGYQYTVLYGASRTGIFQFLEHYADFRTSQSGLVIVRRVEDNLYETALKFIRYTKDYIQQNINLQSDTTQKVEWIFEIKNGQIPLQQIQRIQKNRPKDRILIGITAKPTLKSFKKVAFPEIPMQTVKQVMVSQFDITPIESEILVSYYNNSIPEIIQNLDEISYTHEKHLGQNYQNLKDLGKGELKTLKKLCKDGAAIIQGNKAPLQEVGVAIFDNVGYWERRVNRLNYELSMGVQCVDKVVPQEILGRIHEQKERESKEEIEAENKPEEEFKPKKSATPPKSQAKTSKKKQKQSVKVAKVQTKQASKQKKQPAPSKPKAQSKSKSKSKSK